MNWGKERKREIEPTDSLPMTMCRGFEAVSDCRREARVVDMNCPREVRMIDILAVKLGRLLCRTVVVANANIKFPLGS